MDVLPDRKSKSTKSAPLRICIIGGGPAAMFFCHAWNQQKKSTAPPHQKLQDLDITCFEMKSTPGGVWRARSNGRDHVYDELWTNGVAHNYEYHDYTFDEHFDGRPPTIFLPRRDVNEYLVGRVTKDHITFFRDYFVFDTQVQLVEEAADDSEGSSFLVTVRHLPTGQISTSSFDRCIWAAGENCVGSIPKALQDLFRDSAGLIRDWTRDDDREIKEAEPEAVISLYHSAETHLIRDHCRDRKVLLIGGELSAEDLALQCLKWGASHVDVATRNGDWCAVSWTSQWPGDKVKVYNYVGVDSVEGSMITLKYVKGIWPSGYMPSHENGDDGEVVLEDIQTVIFCTGYSANLDMLDPSLRPECGLIPRYKMGDHPSLFVTDIDWSTWKMQTNHAAHTFTGDVSAGQKRMLRSNCNHPDMHRDVFFKNTHMMYLCEHGSEFPLLSLDVHAWLLCLYLTSRVPLPPVEEMKKANIEQFLDQMHLPVIRLESDEAYYGIINSEAEYWGESDESSLEDESSNEDDSNVDDDEDPPCDLDELEYRKYQLRLLCKVMEEGKYPGVSLGNYDSLNENGNQLLKHANLDYEARALLKTDYPKDSEWRTYRDAVEQAKSVFSLYTGTQARPLNKRWMDSKEGRHTTIRSGGV